MTTLRFSAVVLVAILAAGCTDECDLDEELRDRGGSSATNCGTVPVGGSSGGVNACVINALAQGSPFFARYEQQGIDSSVALGVVRDEEGTVIVMMWDSDPSGGSQEGAVVSGWICEGASPGGEDSGSMPISCASTTDLGYVCKEN